MTSDIQQDSSGSLKHHLTVLPTNKPHISFSEYSQWENCSWAHNLAHVRGLKKDFISVHAEFGSAVHAVAENFLKTREIDVDILFNEIRTRWETARENIKELPEEERENQTFNFTKERILKGKKVLFQSEQDWIDQGLAILAELPSHFNSNFPDWEYVDAEHQLYEPIKFGDDTYAFKGFIDGVITCRAKRGKKRETWLIDWKTSTSGWRAEKKQDQLTKKQLIFYKIFWTSKMNVDPATIRCAFIILKRTGKPGTRCDTFPISVGPKTLERTKKDPRNMIASLRRGVAIKNRYSCKWCEFFGTEHCDSIIRKL